MAGPQPCETIAEGDVVLIRARVRKVWHDAVVVRVATHDGSAVKFTQLCVRPSVVAGRDPVEGAGVPPIDWLSPAAEGAE